MSSYIPLTDIEIPENREKEQEDYFEDEFNITLFYAAHIFDEDESEENPLYQQKDESDEEEVLVSTLDVGKDFEITLDELLEYEED